MLAAIGFGASNFASGFALRRLASSQVSVVVHSAEFVLFLFASPFAGGALNTSAVLWGGACGLAYAVGIRMLLSALQSGRTTLVAPVYALSVALVPVGAGLLALERPGPLTWVGIVLALVAIVLLCHRGSSPAANPPPAQRSRIAVVLTAAGAGIAFGLGFVSVSRTGDHDGLWPYTIATGVSSLLLWIGILPIRKTLSWIPAPTGLAVIAGVLATAGNVAALYAFRNGTLTVTGALVGLGPAVLVVLAVIFTRERAGLNRSAGLVFGFSAVTFISIGNK